MQCGFAASNAEANARLLYKLLAETKASDVGSICGFFDTSHTWRCPCCYRSKEEIARLDKNNNLLCALHHHHDHFEDLASAKIPLRFAGSVTESFARFPPTMICADCNVAESTVAKRAVGAPAHFSFAPFEIASFIILRMNAPHSVDVERAQKAFEAAKPSMALISERLRAVIKSIQVQDDSFEHVGGPAWRVLKELNEKRDKTA